MLVDKVLLIDASEARQIERTQQRDNIDATAVGAIIASQWSRAQRQAQADYIIDNDGTWRELEEAVEKMHQQFLTLASLNKAQKSNDKP